MKNKNKTAKEIYTDLLLTQLKTEGKTDIKLNLNNLSYDDLLYLANIVVDKLKSKPEHPKD
jgi:hypothetical protein